MRHRWQPSAGYRLGLAITWTILTAFQWVSYLFGRPTGSRLLIAIIWTLLASGYFAWWVQARRSRSGAASAHT